MTLILTIHGRDYRVPPELEPEPAHCQAFHDAIAAQLHAAAAKAGVPKATVTRKKFTADGNYLLDATGEVETFTEQHWLDLPAALHETVQVPTAAAILPPPATPAAPVVAATPDEEG